MPPVRLFAERSVLRKRPGIHYLDSVVTFRVVCAGSRRIPGMPCVIRQIAIPDSANLDPAIPDSAIPDSAILMPAMTE